MAGKDKKELRVSLPPPPPLYRETGVHLGGDVAQILGKEFRGAGSGHPTAAGVNCRGNLDALLKRAVSIISSNLKE